jgi:hypothetical protein
MRRFLMCLPIPFVLLPRFLLALLFNSHVVSNDASRDSTQNGMMMRDMPGNRADSGSLEAALRFGGGNAAQGKASGDCRDHDMLHGRNAPDCSFGHLGRREREFNRA